MASISLSTLCIFMTHYFIYPLYMHIMYQIHVAHASFIRTINCAAHDECVVPCSDSNPCSNSIINCPTDADCQIQCDDTESCKEITVNGPTNHDLYIYCSGELSCFNSTFKASQAASLSIEGCQADQSCLDLNIYCPSRHANGSKNCYIEGNDNLGAYYEWRPMHLYAKNGWLDVDIEYNGTYNQIEQYFHVGIMHCTNVSEYDMQCDISLASWSCQKPSDYCNNPEPISFTNITSTKVDTNKGGKHPITINIDMNEMLLPLILGVVLMCCIIGACCVWYKIICDKKEKKSVISPPITLVNNDQNNDKSEATDVVHDIYRASIVSSQDSPALSSIVMDTHNMRHNPNRNSRAKVRQHTFDMVELQQSNRKQSYSNRQMHGYNVSNMSNISMHAQAQRQIQNHHHHHGSQSSLALPTGKHHYNGRQASRGSESSHDHEHDDRPFNVHDLEGSVINDAAEYDPEGFSINHAEDIDEDDIASELPQSPPDTMLDANDSSDSEIYLEASQAQQLTPKTHAMSEITDMQSNVGMSTITSQSNVAMSIITLVNIDENRDNNKTANNEAMSTSEDSGSDDMYVKGNEPEQSPMGPAHITLAEVPQRKHKMSMDIATDVSVH